jgi:hypothetical protein
MVINTAATGPAAPAVSRSGGRCAAQLPSDCGQPCLGGGCPAGQGGRLQALPPRLGPAGPRPAVGRRTTAVRQIRDGDPLRRVVLFGLRYGRLELEPLGRRLVRGQLGGLSQTRRRGSRELGNTVERAR